MKQRKRLAKLFNDEIKFAKLSTIGAYWKNDKPNGIGYYVPLDDEATCHIYVDVFEAYQKHYEDADKAERLKQISSYRGQLDNHKEWIKDNPGFEACLIGNIWFLESIGLIVPDNFNGMLAIWQK